MKLGKVKIISALTLLMLLLQFVWPLMEVNARVDGEGGTSNKYKILCDNNYFGKDLAPKVGGEYKKGSYKNGILLLPGVEVSSSRIGKVTSLNLTFAGAETGADLSVFYNLKRIAIYRWRNI